ncbi:hypothetical protein THAOC_30408, partial [Thalassiosira oceanica]
QQRRRQQRRRKITAVGQGDPRRLLRLRRERHRVRATPRHVRLPRRLRRPRPDEAPEGRAQRVHIQRPAEQDSLRRGEQRRRHGTVLPVRPARRGPPPRRRGPGRDAPPQGGLRRLRDRRPRPALRVRPADRRDIHGPPLGWSGLQHRGEGGVPPRAGHGRRGRASGGDAGGSAAVDGAELLRIAAGALESRIIGYDLPRNTNKMSLARACLDAGYEGHVKLEEVS